MCCMQFKRVRINNFSFFSKDKKKYINSSWMVVQSTRVMLQAQSLGIQWDGFVGHPLPVSLPTCNWRGCQSPANDNPPQVSFRDRFSHGGPTRFTRGNKWNLKCGPQMDDACIRHTSTLSNCGQMDLRKTCD